MKTVKMILFRSFFCHPIFLSTACSKQNAALAETLTPLWEGPSTPSGASAEHPEHIGRYKVIGVLGRGGFGTVYCARDEELQRDVAIRVWRPDRFSGDSCCR